MHNETVSGAGSAAVSEQGELPLPSFFQGWQFPEGLAPTQLSFSAGMESLDEDSLPAAVWRMDLPAEIEQASQVLKVAERRAALAEAALDQAALSAGMLAHQTYAETRPAVAGPLSFSTGMQDQPDGRLVRKLQATLHAVSAQATRVALIETSAGGQLVGRSRVGWSGGIATLWAGSLPPGYPELHRRSLGTALASRAQQLRLAALALQVAVQAAAIMSAPVSAVWLLPKAWSNLLQIVDQFQ